jgi:hypothetical protein
MTDHRTIAVSNLLDPAYDMLRVTRTGETLRLVSQYENADGCFLVVQRAGRVARVRARVRAFARRLSPRDVLARLPWWLGRSIVRLGVRCWSCERGEG